MSDQERVWINIIGKPGAGKSTIAEYYREYFAFEIFRPSDVLRDYAHANNIALACRQDYVDLHQKIIAEDPDVMTRKVLDNPAPRLVIDGLRVVAHARTLQRAGMLTLALDCSPNIRLEHIKQDDKWRQYRDAGIETVEDLLADEAADNGNSSHDNTLPDVEAVMGMANHRISTEQHLDFVQAEAATFLNRLNILSPLNEG